MSVTPVPGTSVGLKLGAYIDPSISVSFEPDEVHLKQWSVGGLTHLAASPWQQKILEQGAIVSVVLW